MREPVWVALLGAAAATAMYRFGVPTHPVTPHGSYEAFAHLFVGGLIGAGFAKERRGCWWVAAVLSVVEVAAFLTVK